MVSYEKEKDKYKTYIRHCYDNLFKIIYFPHKKILIFEDYPHDFDVIQTDEKYTVVFKSIKPKTTLSIFKKTKLSEICVDAVFTNGFKCKYVERESILNFDNALYKILKQLY